MYIKGSIWDWQMQTNKQLYLFVISNKYALAMSSMCAWLNIWIVHETASPLKLHPCICVLGLESGGYTFISIKWLGPVTSFFLKSGSTWDIHTLGLWRHSWPKSVSVIESATCVCNLTVWAFTYQYILLFLSCRQCNFKNE